MEKKSFKPIRIIGLFWLVFGSIILVSTFFVTGNKYIDKEQGVITNLIAAFLLIAAGIISQLKGRESKS